MLDINLQQNAAYYQYNSEITVKEWLCARAEEAKEHAAGKELPRKNGCEPGSVGDVKTDMERVVHSSEMLGERNLLWTQIKIYSGLYSSDQIMNTAL